MDSQQEMIQPILNQDQLPPSTDSSDQASHNIAQVHDYDQVDSSLEKILSETSSEMSFFKRFGSASWIELRLLYRLAAPAVFVYMINNVMSLSTRVVCGHLGNLQLAAASLANNGIQLFTYGLMVLLHTAI